MESKALGGDLEAIKVYMAYCFGKPESKVDITSDGEQIGYDLSRLSVEQLNNLRTIRQAIETK